MPVFPCNADNKKPLTEHGFKDATTSSQIIDQWASKYPNALVGIPTGERTGVTVLDFDPECDATAEQMLPGLPESLMHKTPSGGVHALFKYTSEAGTIGTDVIQIPPGVCSCGECQIDLRNDGGYIIVPGSVMADGGRYTVISKVQLAEMPHGILAKLQTHKRKRKRVLADPTAMFREGQRNSTLASLAGTMRSRGMSQATIEAALLIENQERCEPPLEESEVSAIAMSIGKYPSGVSERGHLVNSDSSVSSQGDISGIPPFPSESLPAVVRKFCEEAAPAIGVPVEMVACPLFAYAGATIGNRQCIQLKPGFVEYPQLWIATVAPPGTAKSPADGAARMPIDELQTEAKNVFDLDADHYRNELQQWKDSPKETRGDAPTAPDLQHYYSTDTTIEALGRILESSPGVALSRDEFVGWVNSMDAYKGGKGSERQHHLSAWSGAPIKVDRKTSDPVFVQHPVVSVTGGVQPDVMIDLAVEAGRRDGFLERILWSVPNTKPSLWSDAEVSREASTALLALFRHLRRPEASLSPVCLSRGAYRLFTSWYNENQKSITETGGLMQGVYAKMPLQLARLTLIIHCLEHPDSPSSRLVSAETMAAAIKLVEYFRGQAGIALAMVGVGSSYRGSGTTARIFQILIKARGEWCSRSKLHQQLGGHTPAEEIGKSLAELEQSGLAEQRKPEAKPAGGRRGEEWRSTSYELTELSEETSREPIADAEIGATTEVTI